MVKRCDNPPDKVLPNGVVVKGSLTVNEMSIQGWYENLFYSERKQPTVEMARVAGFSDAEIIKQFGSANT